MIRKIVFVFAFFLFFTSFFSLCQAQEFSSFYKTTYEFASSGEARVTQEISLINQSADYYVSEYGLNLVGGKITDVAAYDSIGPLKVKTQEKDENTLIVLTFNEKVVGKGKVLSFILKYRIVNLAQKEGNLWQITIPKLVEKEKIDDYQLLIKLPKTMGKVAFVNPTPRSEEQDEGFTLLNFHKEDLLNYGVAITLGQYQTFVFRLNYWLKNPTANPVFQEIALPPDTDYQTVFYQSIQPEPETVTIDADGNWLAQYLLEPGQELNITADGQVNIFSQPQNKNDKLPNADWLAEKKYWPVNDERIKKLAQELKTPEKIYRYVVNNLTYDYKEIKKDAVRKGAVEVLAHPEHSVCSDFTDLFVSLCRAAGIPARELSGYAYSENEKIIALAANDDVLHSWAEYFDTEKKRWIMVDPTWENTSGGLDYFRKFDMAHFVFAIHGQDSVLPLPAGSYKQGDNKQILVSFGKEIPPGPKYFSLKKISPKTIYSLKGNQLILELKNESGYALYQQSLEGMSDRIMPRRWLLDNLPPYGKQKITLTFKPEEIMRDYETGLSFQIEGEKDSVLVVVNSLALRVVLIFGSISTLFLVYLLLNLRKRKLPEERAV